MKHSTMPVASPAPALIVATQRPLLGEALGRLAARIPEIAEVAWVPDLERLVRVLRFGGARMLLIDDAMVGALARAIEQKPPQVRVLLISTRPHAGVEPPCGQGCACAFASETLATTRLEELLRVMAQCPEVATGSARCATCPLQGSLAPAPLPLSPRESGIFAAIGRGETAGGIAAELGLSVKTVEGYREVIKQKLGLQNAAELREAALLWRRGELAFHRLPPAAWRKTTLMRGPGLAEA